MGNHHHHLFSRHGLEDFVALKFTMYSGNNNRGYVVGDDHHQHQHDHHHHQHDHYEHPQYDNNRYTRTEQSKPYDDPYHHHQQDDPQQQQQQRQQRRRPAVWQSDGGGGGGDSNEGNYYDTVDEGDGRRGHGSNRGYTTTRPIQNQSQEIQTQTQTRPTYFQSQESKTQTRPYLQSQQQQHESGSSGGQPWPGYYDDGSRNNAVGFYTENGAGEEEEDYGYEVIRPKNLTDPLTRTRERQDFEHSYRNLEHRERNFEHDERNLDHRERNFEHRDGNFERGERNFEHSSQDWREEGRRRSLRRWEDLAEALPSRMDITHGTLRFRKWTVRGRGSAQSDDWHDPHNNHHHQTHPGEESKSVDEVLEALTSVREQPWTLATKRATRNTLRDVLDAQKVRWYNTRPVTSAVRKGGNKIANFLSASYVWSKILKPLEGRYGSSVVAVFNFLRFVIQLDLLLALILLGGVVIPWALRVAEGGDEGGKEQYPTTFIPPPPTPIQGEGNHYHYHHHHDQQKQYPTILNSTFPPLPPQGFHWYAPSGNCDNRPPDLCTALSLTWDIETLVCNNNYTRYVDSVVEDHQHKVAGLIRDFLLGTGFLEWTALFSGYYPASVGEDSYLVSLAYILSVLAVYLVSLVAVVYFVAKFLRQAPRLSHKYGLTYTRIVFTGWDFAICEKGTAKTEHSLILSEFRMALDDEQHTNTKKRRTRNEWIKLFLVRIVINLLILILIIGGWVGIFYLVKEAQQHVSNPLERFVWNYMPTVTTSIVNFIYPLIFNIVVKYEHYRGRKELFITLMRCVFIRLTSLTFLIGTKLDFISRQSRTCDAGDEVYICWETHMGQQLYSVLILDFLIQIVLTFVLNVCRKFLRRFKNSWFQSLAYQEFYVPGHVLDIVYVQCILWLSVPYAPLMPVVCWFYLLLLFAFKFFTVSVTCVPATRVFRASSSSSMFMTVLCLAFALCVVGTYVGLFYICPSKACSPFRGLGNTWEVITYYICRLEGAADWLRWVLFTMDDPVFLSMMVLAVVMVLVYYVSKVKALNALLARMEDKLKHTAKENIYLKKHGGG
ncbi:hypothetical protein Pcinc_027746 [Petrolisthes cinctipes]|uniref:TMC domain-containing protein n=1 Tax=Petrolisthes cinctipes TaxID=88211 RepID=A0AAE1K9V5_PETCI|nr:hypothetical protein Pcinc_027746 [Petrolisthes cinctipes]